MTGTEILLGLAVLALALTLVYATVTTLAMLRWKDRHDELLRKPLSFWVTRDQFARSLQSLGEYPENVTPIRPGDATEVML